MGYCTQTDVEAINATSYTTTTKPTATQVAILIDNGQAEIDSIFTALGLATPVSSNQFLIYMNALHAAAFAEAAYKRNNTKTPDADWRLKKFNDMKEQLMKNPELGGVTVPTSEANSRSNYSTGFGGLSDYDFEKDSRGW